MDNGPGGLNRDANDSLYSARGLADARRALTAGGPDERFTQRMRAGGFATEEHRVRATGGGRGARHVIWIGVS